MWPTAPPKSVPLREVAFLLCSANLQCFKLQIEMTQKVCGCQRVLSNRKVGLGSAQWNDIKWGNRCQSLWGQQVPHSHYQSIVALRECFFLILRKSPRPRCSGVSFSQHKEKGNPAGPVQKVDMFWTKTGSLPCKWSRWNLECTTVTRLTPAHLGYIHFRGPL